MYKITGKYTKTGNLKYISHLDVLRLMQRAVRRANIPASYSEGFNPHLKITFGFPLSLGVESLGEYFELIVDEKIDIDNFIKDINAVLPKEMQVLKAEYYDGKESLMTKSQWTEYLIKIESDALNIERLDILAENMVKAGLEFSRTKKGKNKKKDKVKTLNTRDLIKYMKVSEQEGCALIETVIQTSSEGSMKGEELVNLLKEFGAKIDYYTILKNDTLDINGIPLIK